MKDFRYAIDRPNGYGLLTHRADDGSKWYSGSVKTAFGIVAVQAQWDWTYMSFVAEGYCYTRHWKRGFQPRYLVTLANAFAEEKSP